MLASKSPTVHKTNKKTQQQTNHKPKRKANPEFIMSYYLKILLLGLMTISRYKSFDCQVLRINRSDKVLGTS